MSSRRLVFMLMLSMCCTYSTRIFAQDCDLTIASRTPTPAVTHFFEPISYQFDVSFREKCRIEIQPLEPDKLLCTKPSVELIPKHKPGYIANRIMVKCKYLSPGFYYSPPFRVRLLDAKQREIGAAVPRMRELEVKPFEAENGHTIALEDHLAFMPWHQIRVRLIALITFVCLLLVAGGIAIFLHYRKRARESMLEMQDIPLKPIEVFLHEIEQLVNVIPVSIEEYKAFHDKLSGAMRTFISQRACTDAMNCTTRHLCRRLAILSLPSHTCSELERILSESDRVKFAYEAPSQGANMILLRDAANLANNIENHYARLEAQAAYEIITHPNSPMITEQELRAFPESFICDQQQDTDLSLQPPQMAQTPQPK